MADADTSVVVDAYLGGHPVAVIGVESRPLPRRGSYPADGPELWTAGTLFPLSSKKTARAINAASGNRPLVVLANLSGFDGSPESLKGLQLEYGAEIGRAIVNFDGPIVFCVVSRYHGGAFVVFSGVLNDRMEVVAVEGSYASVIGGAPAAAVVFAREVTTRTASDPRVAEGEKALAAAAEPDRAGLRAELARLRATGPLGEAGRGRRGVRGRPRHPSCAAGRVRPRDHRRGRAAAVPGGRGRPGGSQDRRGAGGLAPAESTHASRTGPTSQGETAVQPFVINRHDRIVFPSNLVPELDLSTIDSLEQLDAVIHRDFETKASTGHRHPAARRGGRVRTRYELLRDVALNMFWTGRFAHTMYEKRPTRWADVPRLREDVFLPVLVPWVDGDRKVAAVRSAFDTLPSSFDAAVEEEIFATLFDVFGHRRHTAAELSPIKPTVADILADPTNLTFRLRGYDADYPVFSLEDIVDVSEEQPELEALRRWSMVLHNQYPWDRSQVELVEVGQLAGRRLRRRLPPRDAGVRAFWAQGPLATPRCPRASAGTPGLPPVRPYPRRRRAGPVRGDAALRGAGGGARLRACSQRGH
jgi:hypothetical protein